MNELQKVHILLKRMKIKYVAEKYKKYDIIMLTFKIKGNIISITFYIKKNYVYPTAYILITNERTGEQYDKYITVNYGSIQKFLSATSGYNQTSEGLIETFG